MAMKAEIKGSKLIITMDLQAPTLSKSEKTLVVATSHGFITTEAIVDDKQVVVGVNAYIAK